MMANFADTLAAMKSADEAMRRELAGVKMAEAELKNKRDALEEMCIEPCLNAIEEYNLVRSLCIEPYGMKIIFDLEENKLSLAVKMIYRSGHEPDEDLDERDIKEIESALRPLIERELEEAGVPLKFAHIKVPYDYYPK